MSKQLVRTKKKVYIGCGDFKLTKMFLNKGYVVDSSEYGMYDSDLIVFSGGEDVCPLLYGEPALPTTFFSIKRDNKDNELYRSLDTKQAKLGICRGAQFLNVMNGGSLVQDCDNHVRSHDLVDHETGKTITVSSTHHQMMRPAYGERVEVIASAEESSYKQYYGYKNKKKENNWPKFHDPEVVYYQDTNSLCVQFHPEYMHNKSSCATYFWDVVQRTLGKDVFPPQGKYIRADKNVSEV